MRIIVVKDYNEMSAKAAQIVASQLTLNPSSILGLATGSTPEGMYKELIRMNKEGLIDFTDVRSFNLDEYKGLVPSHDQSYDYFMKDKFFNHINIDHANTRVPNGVAADFEEEGRSYDLEIEKAGGIDLQILGIGSNAHIAFNEPGPAFEVGTHVVKLTPETIEANSRFFENVADVPTEAITMGVGSIFKAKKIVLLASGAGKAQAILDTLKGKVQPGTQSSILQLHPDVTLIIDEAAAALI